jgi:7-alpha-hydroxysteroid dehydrogenase
LLEFLIYRQNRLVSGGANGIGKACSLMLARFGANVVVADMKTNDGQKAIDEIESQGGTVWPVACNVLKDAELVGFRCGVSRSCARLT